MKDLINKYTEKIDNIFSNYEFPVFELNEKTESHESFNQTNAVELTKPLCKEPVAPNKKKITTFKKEIFIESNDYIDTVIQEARDCDTESTCSQFSKESKRR